MATTVHGICPKTKYNLVYYDGINPHVGEFGIARYNAGRWSYPDSNWNWTSTPSIYFKTAAEAMKAIDDYIARNNTKENNVTMVPSTQPGLQTNALKIDKDNNRVVFRCPKCNSLHKTQMTGTWAGLDSKIFRSCPKLGQDNFQINIYNDSREDPVAPFGEIPIIGDYNCKECWGTAEYVGFNKVESCSMCVKKSV